MVIILTDPSTLAFSASGVFHAQEGGRLCGSFELQLWNATTQTGQARLFGLAWLCAQPYCTRRSEALTLRLLPPARKPPGSAPAQTGPLWRPERPHCIVGAPLSTSTPTEICPEQNLHLDAWMHHIKFLKRTQYCIFKKILRHYIPSVSFSRSLGINFPAVSEELTIL